jgi:phage FluMu protein Com
VSLRNFILKFMSPKMRAEAEADSHKWMATCPRCQSVNSIWDIGGIRYKAVGGRPITLVRCPNCGKISPHRFEKRA